MRRRDFIALLGGTAATWPLAARAQNSDRMRRIGALLNGAGDDPFYQARIDTFTQGLQQLGWIEGRNLHTDIRWVPANAGLFRRYAEDLIALAPDLVLAHSSPAVAALQQETRTVPIVFIGVVDPVGAGFVSNLARPGGNTTGFSALDYGMRVLGSVLFLGIVVWVIGIRASWKFHSQCAPHYTPDRRFVLLVCVLFGPFAMALPKIL